MADALFITGSVDYDGDRWFTSDPLVIDVQVDDPSGSALSGADVTVALVTDEDAVESKKMASADPNGEVLLSLTASQVGVYQILAGAKTANREGYATIDTQYAHKKPPFAIQGVTKAGELDLDLTESNHSITTALV